jgi:hypothetical protein
MNISIRIASTMPTRPCRFCLALQDDSVFADFDIDTDKRVYLCRISFDGYGCCHCEKSSTRMNLLDSAFLMAGVEKNELYNIEIEKVLIRYFHENRKAIWIDALANHGLLFAAQTQK